MRSFSNFQKLGFSVKTRVFLIRWFYLTIRCALQSGRDVNPSTSGTTLWLGIAVKVSRTGEGLLLLRPYYFRISTVRPLVFNPIVTSAPMVLFSNLGVRYIRNPARFCRLDSCQNLGHWGGLIIIKALFPDFHRSPLGT